MKASLALIGVLGAITLAQAQPPRTPPSPANMAQHEVQRYTTLLSLSPTQVEQATALFTTEATARESSHTTQRTAHQALEAAIKTNDTATIQSTAASLGQMEGERLSAHALARAQFYALLTADQKSKYAELEEGHRMGGPEHGPPM